MLTRKYYPRSKLVKKTKKATTTRTTKHKTLAADRESQKLAYFNQKLSAATQNVEKAKDTYAAEFDSKSQLTLSALGTPSLDHILTFNAAFDHTYLHLTLYDHLSATDM